MPLGVITDSEDSLRFNPSPALAGVRPPDKGLGGRLDVRTPKPLGPLRGGCGKAFMLTCFRIVFPAELTPKDLVPVLVVFNFGSDVVFPAGDTVAEGDLRPLFARAPARRLDAVGTAPTLLRVLGRGRAGSAVVGGP